MKCPYCFSPSNKVVDKRETENDKAVRRRRECKECNKRFTTYERIEGAILFVKKKKPPLCKLTEFPCLRTVGARQTAFRRSCAKLRRALAECSA